MLLQGVDCVTIPVPDLESGLWFYRDVLGHEVAWRNSARGQIGLRIPGQSTEIVLAVDEPYAPAWRVESADEASRMIVEHGGRMVFEPADIPVGRLAIVEDPFGNVLVLLDLSRGTYVTGPDGEVTGLTSAGDRP